MAARAICSAVPGSDRFARGPVQLREAGQDHALVVGPRGVAAVPAVAAEAVADQVAAVDHAAVVEPRPLGLRHGRIRRLVRAVVGLQPDQGPPRSAVVGAVLKIAARVQRERARDGGVIAAVPGGLRIGLHGGQRHRRLPPGEIGHPRVRARPFEVDYAHYPAADEPVARRVVMVARDPRGSGEAGQRCDFCASPVQVVRAQQPSRGDPEAAEFLVLDRGEAGPRQGGRRVVQVDGVPSRPGGVSRAQPIDPRQVW